MTLSSVQKQFEQYPADLLDYDFQFNRLSATDSIKTVGAAVSGSDTVLTVDHIDVSGITAKVWLTNGSAGVLYTIKVSIVSNEGRKRALKLKLSVLDPNA